MVPLDPPMNMELKFNFCVINVLCLIHNLVQVHISISFTNLWMISLGWTTLLLPVFKNMIGSEKFSAILHINGTQPINSISDKKGTKWDKKYGTSYLSGIILEGNKPIEYYSEFIFS